jgi:hypothetical protein
MGIVLRAREALGEKNSPAVVVATPKALQAEVDTQALHRSAPILERFPLTVANPCGEARRSNRKRTPLACRLTSSGPGAALSSQGGFHLPATSGTLTK